MNWSAEYIRHTFEIQKSPFRGHIYAILDINTFPFHEPIRPQH